MGLNGRFNTDKIALDYCRLILALGITKGAREWLLESGIRTRSYVQVAKKKGYSSYLRKTTHTCAVLIGALIGLRAISPRLCPTESKSWLNAKLAEWVLTLEGVINGRSMGWNYETQCADCGARLKVVEKPMGVPGGKDKEQGYCPQCNHLVAEFMTDGFIRVELLGKAEPNC